MPIKYIYDFTESERSDPLVEMQVDNILKNVVAQLGPQISLKPGQYTFRLEFGVSPVERNNFGVKQRWLAIDGVVAVNQENGYSVEVGFPNNDDQRLLFPVTVDQ